MKTLEKEIVDMENFYKTATIEEAIAYFKNVSAKCFDTLKQVISEVKSLVRKKSRSSLQPMRCRMIIPHSRRGLKFESWKQYIKIESKITQTINFLNDQVEMEGLLYQALEILTKK